jgi:hypothetical protein
LTYAKPKASGLAPRGFSLGRLKARIEALVLIPAPDLGSIRWIALTALAVTVIVAAVLISGGVHLATALGDTDDATRLVFVRQLLDGGGWWSGQHLMRFQPPLGLYMHWSRLLDGGIAALDLVFRLGLSAADAETATRFLWPLLWIFPAALAAMLIARRLGLGLAGDAAVLIAAVILASDIPLYVQFHPGRIDHHDVQMTLAFLALAGAIQRRPSVKGAILAGVATGLGLAVGLEGLVFDAVIGASIALHFLFDPRQAREARAYALSLAASTLLAFLIQTPPWRWGVPACDALAVNLTAAVAAAGMGLFLATRFTAGRGLAWRLGALALVAIVAGGVYLGVYPRCRAGFFADVDPRIRPIWLNYVQEIRPIWGVVKRSMDQGVAIIAFWVWGLVAWLVLGMRRERWTDPAWWVCGLCLSLGVVFGANLIRASGYPEWFAVPIVAAATAEVLARLGYRNLFVVLLAAAVASPVTASGIAVTAADHIAPLFPSRGKARKAVHPAAKAARKMATGGGDSCFSTPAFQVLRAARPVGLVLSDVDLGAFILANTDHSALSGPYHRMGWGILKAHAILKSPADATVAGGAYDAARAAGVSYVLECRRHAGHGDRSDMGKQSLQKRLDAGQAPAWLQPLSPADAPLQVYRVLPPEAVAKPPSVGG